MLDFPMIDRSPIELRAEVPHHLAHQVGDEGAQVGHLESGGGQDDELEVMRVIDTSLRKTVASNRHLDSPSLLTPSRHK
jgi:hypothetical protein